MEPLAVSSLKWIFGALNVCAGLYWLMCLYFLLSTAFQRLRGIHSFRDEFWWNWRFVPLDFTACIVIAVGLTEENGTLYSTGISLRIDEADFAMSFWAAAAWQTAVHVSAWALTRRRPKD